MGAQQKPKTEKQRGVTNGMRRCGKAWKKGSINNGDKVYKFDQNGVQMVPGDLPGSMIPRAQARARRRDVRKENERIQKKYADAVAEHFARLETAK